MKHRETNYGKGDTNRSNFSKFQTNFDNINFYGTQPFYDEDGEDGEGWYFWDETYSIAHGPFNTRQAATNARKKYCEMCL